jgi:glyoxylase-like metal-dependent hydrolase (beta-lactamase superfamily II)
LKLHFLSGGRLRMRRFVFEPAAPRQDTIELPVSCALIRHPAANVLFDTGCNPAVAGDPAARWGGLARAMVPIFTPQDTLDAQLPQLGLSADDIDVVVCSHLHPDHCGCNDQFRRATIVCHAAELAAVKAEGAEQAGYLPQEWDQPQGFSTFEGQKDLFGDGRVVLLHMPGHTPGMTCAMVGLDRDGQFLLASDAAPLASNLEACLAPKNSWNAERATQALQEVRRIRDSGVTVIMGHDDAQWQGLRKGEAFFA